MLRKEHFLIEMFFSLIIYINIKINNSMSYQQYMHLQGITRENHVQDGAIAGAAREAVAQIADKAIGLNGGGKIAIARFGEHLSVCIFMSIGLLHLNDVVIGLGHRSLPMD